jgi:hypothetical protein
MRSRVRTAREEHHCSRSGLGADGPPDGGGCSQPGRLERASAVVSRPMDLRRSFGVCIALASLFVGCDCGTTPAAGCRSETSVVTSVAHRPSTSGLRSMRRQHRWTMQRAARRAARAEPRAAAPTRAASVEPVARAHRSAAPNAAGPTSAASSARVGSSARAASRPAAMAPTPAAATRATCAWAARASCPARRAAPRDAVRPGWSTASRPSGAAFRGR